MGPAFRPPAPAVDTARGPSAAQGDSDHRNVGRPSCLGAEESPPGRSSETADLVGSRVHPGGVRVSPSRGVSVGTSSRVVWTTRYLRPRALVWVSDTLVDLPSLPRRVTRRLRDVEGWGRSLGKVVLSLHPSLVRVGGGISAVRKGPPSFSVPSE